MTTPTTFATALLLATTAFAGTALAIPDLPPENNCYWNHDEIGPVESLTAGYVAFRDGPCRYAIGVLPCPDRPDAFCWPQEPILG